MRVWFVIFLFAISVLPQLSCGGKQPGTKEAPVEEEEEAIKSEEEAVVSAKSRIQEWLGKDLTASIASVGKELGKDIGQKLAADEKVISQVKSLSTTILKDREIKAQLKKISDKATEGLGNKLTLGWKALKAGGIDAYKKKVKEDASRVGVDVLTAHLKDHVLKDERTALLLKDFGPALKIQGKVAAVAVQENLSPRVTKKILTIALRIAAAGDKSEMANRVEAWIAGCQEHTEDEVEKLIRKVAELPSVEAAVAGLAIEVLKHDTTKKELKALAKKIVSNKEVSRSLVKVYEAAAFEKGDAQIRKTMTEALQKPIVDQELFSTMAQLAGAEGAGSMIGRYTAQVVEDPALADLVENFVMSLLEACGDPTEANP